MIHDLNERNSQILKTIIDAYVETGTPIGSKLISQTPGIDLSPATIRNVMAELEDLGLLYSPHTSAGRLPTDSGLTVFVDSLLEVNNISADEKKQIDRKLESVKNNSVEDILEQTTNFLSGISSCTGLVFTPKIEESIKQIEFILLSTGKALVIMVTNSGVVENRYIEVAKEVTASTMQQATNYLNSRIANKTLQQATEQVTQDLASNRIQIDALTKKLVEQGIADLSPDNKGGHLFIKGQSHLLDDVNAIEDLEKVKSLFETLETKETMLELLKSTTQGEGVKIFIGSENSLFSHSGCSMIVSSYKNEESQILGAVGVIGPSRLNYGRIIPVVRYTSQMISKIIK